MRTGTARAAASIGFAVAALAFMVSLATPVHAVTGRVTEGSLNPLKIAIPEFLGADEESGRLGASIAGVIAADLQGSGLFEPIDPAAFIERGASAQQVPRFADWRVLEAEALAVGNVTSGGNGRLEVAFRLWDVYTGRQSAGQSFAFEAGNWRRVAHLIADVIYERLTGEAGYFDTRVVFVDESGPKDRRVKRLAIMDQDGANVRVLSRGDSLVLTPRFSPTSQLVTYMSYDGGRPSVHLMNIDSGERQVVGDFPTMSFAPRFSPDGRKIIMSLQQGGASAIHELDLQSRTTRQLTQANAIDTAPSYAPDGRQIVFESDREAGQQLFVMNADGSDQRRISFGEGRYSTPVWSPRGDLIAFTKQYAGRFLIGVMAPDGSGERILTGGFHNEGPTWAPNGRVLMFFRESPGENGGPAIYSIDLTGYNERRVPTPSFASDPAWSPRLGR